MLCRVIGAVVIAAVVSSSLARAESREAAPSDSDLMYEALKRWRGESSADGAAVERLRAAAKRESRRREESILRGATSTFWRDPFADDPELLIPARREDRE